MSSFTCSDATNFHWASIFQLLSFHYFRFHLDFMLKIDNMLNFSGRRGLLGIVHQFRQHSHFRKQSGLGVYGSSRFELAVCQLPSVNQADNGENLKMWYYKFLPQYRHKMTRDNKQQPHCNSMLMKRQRCTFFTIFLTHTYFASHVKI